MQPIILKQHIPNKNRYFELFLTTGWNDEYHVSPEDLETANRNSWLSLAAYDNDRLVGFGRIVTDFVLHAVIYDLIVLPDYQGRGIGTLILQTMIRKCLDRGIRDIQLFCAAGKRSFYERNGFRIRHPDAPGMQFERTA